MWAIVLARPKELEFDHRVLSAMSRSFRPLRCTDHIYSFLFNFQFDLDHTAISVRKSIESQFDNSGTSQSPFSQSIQTALLSLVEWLEYAARNEGPKSIHWMVAINWMREFDETPTLQLPRRKLVARIIRLFGLYGRQCFVAVAVAIKTKLSRYFFFARKILVFIWWERHFFFFFVKVASVSVFVCSHSS